VQHVNNALTLSLLPHLLRVRCSLPSQINFHGLIGKQKKAVSLAETIYAAVCVMAAEPEGIGSPIDEWLSTVASSEAEDSMNLRRSGVEDPGFTLIEAISGGYNIGRMATAPIVQYVAAACSALGGGNFTPHTVMHYMTAVKQRRTPAMHHSGKGGVRLNTIGAAKMVAEYITQNRSEIAVALSDARDGGSSSSSSSGGSGMGPASLAQRAVAGSARSQARKDANVASIEAALNSGGGASAKPSISKRSCRRAASAVLETAMGAAGSPASASAILAEAASSRKGQQLGVKQRLQMQSPSTNDTSNIVQAYAAAKARKDDAHARSLLSLLCGSRTKAEVQHLFFCDPSAGDTVRIGAASAGSDGAVRYGKLLPSGSVHCFCPTPAYSALRFDSTVEQEAVLRAAINKEVEPLLRVAPEVTAVLARGACRGGGADPAALLQDCGVQTVEPQHMRRVHGAPPSEWELREAALHAAAFGAGLPVPAAAPRLRDHYTGVRGMAITGFIADHLTVVAASNKAIARGVTHARTEKVKPLWRRLKRYMKKNPVPGVKPPGWRQFSKMARGKHIVDLTAENCCCGLCKALGFSRAAEQRAILREACIELEGTALSDGVGVRLLKPLLDRIARSERFAAAAYAREVSEQSSGAYTCERHALSCHSDKRFAENCTHARSADSGDVGTPQQTVAQELQQAATALARMGKLPKTAARLRRDTWNNDCEYCDDIGGTVLMCQHCELSSCTNCAAKRANDFDHTKGGGVSSGATFCTKNHAEDLQFETGWACEECSREIAAERHCANNDEVSEIFWINEDIARVVGQVSDEQQRRVLQDRLALVERDTPLLLAHKLRHAVASRTKASLLQRLGLTGVLNLADYFGKLKRRRAMQEPCSGTESGFSVHGSVFVIRNLTEQERSTIGSGTDWTGIPLPEEAEFLEIDCRTISDCSKQNPFTMRSSMEAELTEFSTKFPHIKLAYRVTDNCSDYHSTQSAIAHNQARCGNIRVEAVYYHESGEGKNEVDSFCARSKAKILTWLDAGNDCEVPEQLQAALTSYRSSGEWTMTIDHDFSLEQVEEKAPAIPAIGSYSCEIHHECGGITFYEAGCYGTGVNLPAASLAVHDQHKLGAGGTGVVMAAADTSGSAKPRKSKAGAEGLKKQKTVAAAAAAAVRSEAATARAAFSASAVVANGKRCKHCGAHFLSDNGLRQHQCKVAKKRSPTVEEHVRERGCESMAAEAEIARSLRYVTATFAVPNKRRRKGGAEAPAPPLGMVVGDGAIVESIDAGGVTDALMTVGVGWRILSVGGTAILSAAEYAAAVAAQRDEFDVVFERAFPQMPQRGWARKLFSKKARTAVSDECRAYLNEAFAAAAAHKLKARAAAVRKLMQKPEAAGGLAAQHRVGISQQYIESFFSRKCRAAKDAALRAIIKAEGADDESEDEEEDDESDVEGSEDEEDDDGWGSDDDDE
jgi:hypothetical protein